MATARKLAPALGDVRYTVTRKKLFSQTAPLNRNVFTNRLPVTYLVQKASEWQSGWLPNGLLKRNIRKIS